MDYLNQLKINLFNKTNEIRKYYSLNALDYLIDLENLAQLHTDQMLKYNFFLHENPYMQCYNTLIDRAKYTGVLKSCDFIGENLADYPAVNNSIILNIFPTSKYLNKTLINTQLLSQNILKGWFYSKGHRENLLNPGFTNVGFGVLLYKKKCQIGEIVYALVTQNFGRRINNSFKYWNYIKSILNYR